jgi:Uma2 family endonuclease
MADSAERRMTVEEFLDWTDGTDTRHMLVDGVVVSMAPPSQVHSRIGGNVAYEVRRRVRPPCTVLSEAGLALAADTCVQADVVMTCEPKGPDRLIKSPRLIVEVLSPSTVREDLAVKILGYQELPSVEEIWAVDSTVRSVRLWRRLAEGWLVTLPIRSGAFRSEVLGTEVALDELYATTEL